MKEFIEGVINTGNYILSEMEERIQKMYVLGKITESEMTELLNLAAENAVFWIIEELDVLFSTTWEVVVEFIHCEWKDWVQ